MTGNIQETWNIRYQKRILEKDAGGSDELRRGIFSNGCSSQQAVTREDIEIKILEMVMRCGTQGILCRNFEI